MTNRLATAVALVLVLFATALPGAAACCVGKPNSKMAAMHVSMPCCAESCTMSNSNDSRDNSNIAIAASPSPQVAAGPSVAVALDATSASVATVSTATEHTRIEFSPPPPFLAHAQFRI